jgi:flagellar hook-associated protein 1 FlgK
MGLVSTLSLAAQSLKAQQLAIQTTGHNLANAATPGYSRQRVDLVTAYPSFQGGVFIGQGVDVAGVARIIDRFAEAELLGLQGNVGYSDAQSRALAAIQQAFPLTGGVTGAIGEFFAAWSDLANNPGGTTERVIVVAKARALGDSLAQSRQILTSVQHNIDQDIRTAVTRVNLLTEQIAGLNKRIAATEVGGEIANDFRDQRQTLLQELTQLTGATAREEGDGQVTVVFGGLLLVGSARYASLDAGSANAAGLRNLVYQSPDGTSFDATALFTGGTIGSLLNARDVRTQDVIDRLDLFAQTLVGEFNQQHALGFGLTGAPGGDLFQALPASAGAAAAVRVDAALAADPRLIAAAAAPAALPGDNRNALAMLGLRSATVAALGGLTMEDHFLSLVGDIGARAQAAQSRADFQQSLLTQAQARRESVSGVNIDEEMTKLIQFQRAFEASSMLVRTADSMYQNLIDMVR